MNVMVTGGAGYIGSVIAARLLERGHTVVVLDDLSRGHAAAVPHSASLTVGDVRDEQTVRTALERWDCSAVIHMAALAEVAESVAQPDRYESVNTHGTASVGRAALAAGVTSIVLSSTAAVYGEPTGVPIPETADLRPTNPYGHSKLAAEAALADVATESGGRLQVTCLRYFNACGAATGHGEDHEPETHLIPLALRAARDGGTLAVFGTDYPTADGTCVRDYVHVDDLARAHVEALERPPGTWTAVNLGTGRGNSVHEVLETVEMVTGLPVRRRLEGRRAGDPPALVASNDLAATLLGWRPCLTLRHAVTDAWAWMSLHPDGYSATDV